MTNITSVFLQIGTLSFIPVQYRWMVPIALLVLGLLMLFKSKDTWKFLIAAIGAGLSYYAVQHYLYKYYAAILIAHGWPLYMPPVIAMVIGAVLLTVLVRFALSAGIGYAAFMYLGVHYSMPAAITASVVIAGVAYFLYNKIIEYLAKAIGAFMMFLGLIMMHVSNGMAISITAIFLLIAMILMVYRKKITAMYHSWQGRSKLKKEERQKNPKPKKEKVKKEKKKRGVSMFKKIGKTVGKITKIVKKADTSIVVNAGATETVQAPVSAAETITHVKADGSIVVETKGKS